MAYAVRPPATLAAARISETAAHSMAIVGAQTLITAQVARIPLVIGDRDYTDHYVCVRLMTMSGKN